MLRPTRSEIDAQAARLCLGSAPVKAHAGARILRRHADHGSLFHAVGPHLPHHIGYVRPPVPHTHVNRNRLATRGKFSLHQSRLLHRDFRKWTVPNERVAVLNLLDHRLRQRTPAGYIAVSYTHLTLPTIYSVSISVVAV